MGGDGNDTLYVANVQDYLYGDDGDDVFILGDATTGLTFTGASFGAIHGGIGANSLMLGGSGNTLNLCGVANNAISNIATIDISGSGNNHIVLDAAALASMGTATLTITGNTGDTYELADTGWAIASVAGGLITYTNGVNTLVVADTMVRVAHAHAAGSTLEVQYSTDILVGGAGDDAFVLSSVGLGTTITGTHFGSIAGGAGIDSLTVHENNATLDVSQIAPGQLSGIESIVLEGNNNTAIIDDAMVAHLTATLGGGVTNLHITGNADDSFELLGSGWVYAGNANGYSEYTNTSGSTIAVGETLTRNITGDNTGQLLVGDATNNRITGGTGNDTLQSFAGNDVIVGGAGDDYINAGAGNNTLTGGSGADTFAWSAANLANAGINYADVITDFSAIDDSLHFTLTSAADLTASLNTSNELVLHFTDTAKGEHSITLQGYVPANSAEDALNDLMSIITVTTM